MTTATIEAIAHLLTLGFQAGPPPHVTAASQKIDAHVCRGLQCDNCGKRGLQYKPLHKGNVYRVAAICPKCHSSQEV